MHPVYDVPDFALLWTGFSSLVPNLLSLKSVRSHAVLVSHYSFGYTKPYSTLATFSFMI